MAKASSNYRGRKQGHKGKACRRGVPILYDELKQRVNLMLTPSSIAQLQTRSKAQGYSCSEYLERWLRGTLPLAGNNERSVD